MYLFNELCVIFFSLHSFYTSTYMANITYLSFERHMCTKKRYSEFRKMLLVHQQSANQVVLWHSRYWLDAEKVVKMHHGKFVQRNFMIIVGRWITNKQECDQKTCKNGGITVLLPSEFSDTYVQ
jgi:hypothetical protein